MNDLRIRRAEPGDAGTITRCAQLAFGIYVPRMGMKPAPMLADHARCIEEDLVFVGELDGDLVGFLVLRPLGDAVLLDTVALVPSCQGKGFGRRFMEFAERTAMENGAREMRLYTNVLMTENHVFYGKAGYTEYDRKCEDGFSRVYYRKLLTDGDRQQA